MKDLWLTYDTPPIMGLPSNFMTILENCKIDTNKNGDTIIKGGTEVPVTLAELKTIAKIFNDAISDIEKENN